MSTIFDAVLGYCRRGWSVIPLRWTGTVEDRKRPRLDSWKPYQTKAATEEQVRVWWTRWPQANIGLVTGAISGLVALDLDGPNAVALLHNAGVFLPETAAVKTGRGYHAVYAHPGQSVEGRADVLTDGNGSHVDVRGDGNYIVAPPSVHGSGHVYQWVVPPEKLAPLPADLLALILRREAPAARTDDAGWLDEAMQGVPESQRNETAARLAGYWLRKLDGNEEDTLRVLSLWGQPCRPPLDAEEERKLRRTVKSVARYVAAERAAEIQGRLPRLHAVNGPAWADELRVSVQRIGTPVSLPTLDALGGLVPGDFVVIAGRPGIGKSTAACRLIAEATFGACLPTLIISTEMTRRDIGRWLAAMLAKCRVSDLPDPLPAALVDRFRQAPVSIVDAGAPSIRDVRALAEATLGLKLLVLDHIGRIVGGRRESRTLEVGDTARGLSALAKDLQCTVVGLCQLNRQVEGRDSKMPRLADLRDSGEVEQEAAAVVFLWSKAEDLTVPFLPVEFYMAKNRFGPTPREARTFNRPALRFEERVP